MLLGGYPVSYPALATALALALPMRPSSFQVYPAGQSFILFNSKSSPQILNPREKEAAELAYSLARLVKDPIM